MPDDSIDQLIELLFKTSRLMKEEMSYTHDLTHLSILQVQTLIFLHQHQNVTMSDIADFFHIELPSATSLLNKLYRHRWVARHEDPQDRRLVRVDLTTKGKTMLEQVMRDRKKKLQKVLSYLSTKEKIELKNILKTLSIRLQRTI